MNQSKNQSGFAPTIIILIVAILIVAGGTGYYFYLSRDEVLRDKTSQQSAPSKEQPAVAPLVEESAIEDKTADWDVYQNEEYGFEMKISEDWINYHIREEKYSTDIISVIEFGLKTNDSRWSVGPEGIAYLWSISIFTPAQYDSFEGWRPGEKGMIGKNEKYIFSITYGQDIPEDLDTSLYESVATKILPTFKTFSPKSIDETIE